jgi:hypothetical protein
MIEKKTGQSKKQSVRATAWLPACRFVENRNNFSSQTPSFFVQG